MKREKSKFLLYMILILIAACQRHKDWVILHTPPRVKIKYIPVDPNAVPDEDYEYDPDEDPINDDE